MGLNKQSMQVSVKTTSLTVWLCLPCSGVRDYHPTVAVEGSHQQVMAEGCYHQQCVQGHPVLSVLKGIKRGAGVCEPCLCVPPGKERFQFTPVCVRNCFCWRTNQQVLSRTCFRTVLVDACHLTQACCQHQLPCAGSTLKVTPAASRCALGSQDISMSPLPGWGSRLQ